MIHGSFTVETGVAASVDRVYAAYAEPELRRRWFKMPGDPKRAQHELDFRAGGHEVSRGVFAPYGDGREEHMEYRATFWDVVPGARIVFGYEFLLDGVRRWVSLVTVELSGLDGGTRVRHTEQYVYLTWAGDGGHDVAHLEGGTRLQHNALVAALAAGNY